MSCTKCDLNELETYVRVGNANVMIVGCRDHLKQLLAIYKAGLATLPHAESPVNSEEPLS